MDSDALAKEWSDRALQGLDFSELKNDFEERMEDFNLMVYKVQELHMLIKMVREFLYLFVHLCILSMKVR